MNIMERVKVEERAKGCRWFYTFLQKNEKGIYFGKYNPSSKKDSHKINFEWIIEATEKNVIKILKEVERRAFA